MVKKVEGGAGRKAVGRGKVVIIFLHLHIEQERNISSDSFISRYSVHFFLLFSFFLAFVACSFVCLFAFATTEVEPVTDCSIKV